MPSKSIEVIRKDTEHTVFRFVASGSKVPVPGEAPAPKTGTLAPGLREGGYNNRLGTLYNVGNHGYSWASSVTTGAGAYYLYFNSGGTSPNNGSNRAHGLQLRCLQE